MIRTALPILAFLAIAASSWANQPLTLQAETAEYDGQEVLLNGNVTVEHDIGTIYADQVMLKQAPGDKNMLFPFIQMEKKIHLDLRDGAQLTCEKADLNYQTMTGAFFGDGEHPYVVYRDDYCLGAQQPGSIAVQGRQMKVNIAKEPMSASQITDIVAEHDVTVDYMNNFRAEADKGVYQRTHVSAGLKGRKQNFDGTIHMEATGAHDFCQITNLNGDNIQAHEINIDTIARQIAFIFPKGRIHVAREPNITETVDFTADTMTWDDFNDILILRDHIVLIHEAMGHIQGDKEIKIFQALIDGKKRLQRVQAEGRTVMTYMDSDQMIHTLTSNGRLLADHIRGRTMLDSPRDVDGKVLSGQQVHFQDSLGVIDGDKVTLLYDMREHSLVPKKFLVQGRVHIRNQFAADPNVGGPSLQYALADIVEYIPETREMVLASRENPRVLFFDKVNNIQVSAPTLRVKRDPMTHKESIQGSGDVRFTFAEREMDQIKKEFGIE